MRIDGYISIKAVRKWLENYQALAVGDQSEDAVAVNSGPKSYDGVSGGQLNKIMLDDAINKLPEEIRYAVRARFVLGFSFTKSAAVMGVAPRTIKARSEKGVRLIHAKVNGDLTNYMLLLEKVQKT